MDATAGSAAEVAVATRKVRQLIGVVDALQQQHDAMETELQASEEALAAERARTATLEAALSSTTEALQAARLSIAELTADNIALSDQVTQKSAIIDEVMEEASREVKLKELVLQFSRAALEHYAEAKPHKPG